MNLRRLGIVLLVFATGLLAFTWYIRNRNSANPDQEAQKQAVADSDQKPAASQPTTATQPASRPTTATQPATKEAAQPVKEAQAPKEPTTRPVEWWDSRQPSPESAVIGSLDEKPGYLLELELTGRGAAVRNVKLTKYFATVADKRLHAKDPAKYEEARQKDPSRYKGHYELLGPVYDAGQARFALATRKVTIHGLPGQEGPLIVDLDTLDWKLIQRNDKSASFEWRLWRHSEQSGQNLPCLRIVKTYTVSESDYSIKVALEAENLLPRDDELNELAEVRKQRKSASRPAGTQGGSQPETLLARVKQLDELLTDEDLNELRARDRSLAVSLDQLGPSSLGQEDRSADYRRTAVGRMNPKDNSVEVDLKPGSERLKDKKSQESAEVGKSDDPKPPVWIGCTNKFFASLMYLQPAKQEQENRQQRAEFYFAATGDPTQYLAGVKFAERKLGPREKLAVDLDIFAGPKKRSIFSDEGPLPTKAIYGKLNYGSTIELRGCWCAPAWLTWGMMRLLDLFSRIPPRNYGVAIILLVILVRVALHPLTKKGQVSMVKMQKLAPQMQKLKEKYKDNKEALNREMMAMYKHAGATPILGCLPMILQMPIWFALYTGLNSAVQLRHEGLLPFWLTDLAAPDAIVSWEKGVSIPVVSWLLSMGGGGLIYSFNLLPILLTIAMFLQMKMSPQTAQAAPDSPQAKQSKMMSYMMPVMMLFIFYNVPSGLNLYIMTSTFAGVAEQKVIRKHIEAREAAQAAAETTVALPGKAPRASRPKKPKGPMWFKRG